MSFVKKVWQNGLGGGTPITKAELDRIETGVDDAHTGLATKVAIGRDSINILDYGVIEGDATSANDASNTVALQAAINAAASPRRKLGAATSFYVKESGSGNTGWVAK